MHARVPVPPAPCHPLPRTNWVEMTDGAGRMPRLWPSVTPLRACRSLIEDARAQQGRTEAGRELACACAGGASGAIHPLLRAVIFCTQPLS